MPDAGQILISGRDVAPLPPYERPVNTVFQHYALFPHRTVAGNVAFGLESKGLPKAEIAARVTRALEMVRLPSFGERRIDQLSGGQKQRVALARAVVMEPEVLLLDEPMAALDLKLRKEMQVEVKNLQERLQITFIFVTHDQDEALIMSDRIAVLSQGRIEQVGTPGGALRAPAHPVRGRLPRGQEHLRGHGGERRRGEGHRCALRAASTLVAADDGGYAPGATVSIGIRPERLRLESVSGTAGTNSLAGILEDEIYLGDSTEWHVRLGELLLIVAEDAVRARNRKRGEAVLVSFDPAAVLRLDAEP